MTWKVEMKWNLQVKAKENQTFKVKMKRKLLLRFKVQG